MPYLNREDKRQQLREWSEKYGHGRPEFAVQHILDLDTEFPDIEIFGPHCISAHCGPGWVRLLRPALEAINRASGRIHQIKQKFNGLRIYWEPSEDLRRDRFDWLSGGRIGTDPYVAHKLYVEAEKAVLLAEMESFSVCELCGSRLSSRTCKECSHES